MNETLYVVAKSHQDYERWCCVKGYQPRGGAVKYVKDVVTLRGLYNVRILCIEGWTQRPDWREIFERVLYSQRRPGSEL